MRRASGAEIESACKGLDGVSAEAVLAEVRRNLYDGISPRELGLAQTMAARSLVEQEPNYSFVSARLLLEQLREEAVAFVIPLASPLLVDAGGISLHGILSGFPPPWDRT